MPDLFRFPCDTGKWKAAMHTSADGPSRVSVFHVDDQWQGQAKERADFVSHREIPPGQEGRLKQHI
jgi:hypothetical protein